MRAGTELSSRGEISLGPGAVLKHTGKEVCSSPATNKRGLQDESGRVIPRGTSKSYEVCISASILERMWNLQSIYAPGLHLKNVEMHGDRQYRCDRRWTVQDKCKVAMHVIGGRETPSNVAQWFM